jgi:hypothetical protein
MWSLNKKTWLAVGCVVALAGVFPLRAQGQDDYNQILDRLDQPIWSGYVAYSTRESVEKRGDFAVTEWGAHAGLFYFRTGLGDLDLQADVDMKIFLGSGGMDLPDEVGSLRLLFDYVARLDEGYSMRLRLRPGLYGELTSFDGNALYFPFGVAGLKSFGPNLAGLAGLNFYPGFDRLVVPEAGVRWSMSDMLLIDAFYPESKIIFRPSYNWALLAGFAFPEFVEYRLADGDGRRSILLDETRMYIGAEYMWTDTLKVMLEAGRRVDRSIDFRKLEGKRNVDDALYFEISIGGML